MKSLISKILKEELNKSIINRIGGNDKIHISKDGDLKFKNVPISEQPTYFKPKGLWFSFGTPYTVDYSSYKKCWSDESKPYLKYFINN